MRVDVETLQRFYATPLGDVARRMIERRIAALWGDAAGLDVLGLGYATPLLETFRPVARRAVALMPAAQGAERWPHDARGLACLGDDQRLPFMDAVFDRVVLVHALEETHSAHTLLREVWRVTAPEGRVVAVAANRTGLWARTDSTPFGHGRPYSRSQLAALLRDALFEPTASTRALYSPPWSWRPLLTFADDLERIGEMVWPAFGGLVMMEAVKRLAAEPAPAKGRVVRARAAA
ncbi:MAG: methyltransferase domain-containing protein, partial [Alphaproteobacteria bacterium]|nr:methyltransferase domain-containing protein [Alphaproteobacteria bacterium]